MTRVMLVSTVVLGLLPLAAMAADDHIIAASDTLKWGPAPSAYPKGAEFAIIAGNHEFSIVHVRILADTVYLFVIHSGY